MTIRKLSQTIDRISIDIITHLVLSQKHKNTWLFFYMPSAVPVGKLSTLEILEVVNKIPCC